MTWYWLFNVGQGVVFKYEGSQIDFGEKYHYFRSMYKTVKVGYYIALI